MIPDAIRAEAPRKPGAGARGIIFRNQNVQARVVHACFPGKIHLVGSWFQTSQ
jgi:hypothetical protein